MNQNKTKKMMLLIGVMVFIMIISIVFTVVFVQVEEDNREKIKIVTSFFPVYVAAANVVDGIDNVELVNLTENVTGCLHDYQLTAKDMKKLETADVFVINGAGMESFTEDVTKNYPDLVVIDASEGIPLLEAEEHDHEHGEEDSLVEESHEDDSDEEDTHEEEDHEEGNAHVWLNPDYYLLQIDNIKNGLSNFDKAHEKQYNGNATEYCTQVETIKKQFEELRDPVYDSTVIFHDSFAYLAQKLGIMVAHTVNLDGDTSLSAGEIAEVVDEIKEKDIQVLISELQFKDMIASSVAEETGAQVYVLNSLVTGELNKEAYIKGMEENLSIIKKVFFQR